MLAYNSGHHHRWLISAIGGLCLIGLGAALALDQLGYVLPYRWLFLILLIPAVGMILDGFRLAKNFGWRTIQPLARFITGVIFGLISVLLSMKLNTGLILPALIVALGIATVVRALAGRVI
jgi:uncharacterized membrane protein